MRLARNPAPKPLSMLTTLHPDAQELSIESSADSPPKLAPYPTLVGTAITGQSTRPPTTEASAPSIPATATTQRADISGSRLASSRCSPATPTSYSRVTRLPSTSAVRAASSATGMSLVPPVATTMLPRAGRGPGQATASRGSSW